MENETKWGQLPKAVFNKLSKSNQDLCENGRWVEMSDFMYESLTKKSFLVVVKVPCPKKDKYMVHTEKKVILIPIHNSRREATLLYIPDHYYKESRSSGYLRIQHFLLPEEYCGKKILALATIQRKFDNNGRQAFIINYEAVKTKNMNGGMLLHELKLGTPNPSPEAVVKIPTDNNKFITFTSTGKILN